MMEDSTLKGWTNDKNEKTRSTTTRTNNERLKQSEQPQEISIESDLSCPQGATT